MATTGIAAALRELHRIHQQRTELQQRLERGPKQIAARRANLAEYELAVAESREKAKRTRIDADAKELQLKVREERILDLKSKLNSANSNREYQALLEQIAADEQANSVLSDEILELFDKLQNEQQVATETEQKFSTAQGELQTITTRITNEQESLISELDRLQKELVEAETQLPPDLKPNYDRMVKARHEDALASVEGGVCAGCYHNITPQMLNELTMSQIVFCKSCGRLLYLPEHDE